MKTGRNDPCPCGSGKKYKKCCIDKPIRQTSQMNTVPIEESESCFEYIKPAAKVLEPLLSPYRIADLTKALFCINSWPSNRSALAQGLTLNQAISDIQHFGDKRIDDYVAFEDFFNAVAPYLPITPWEDPTLSDFGEVKIIVDGESFPVILGTGHELVFGAMNFLPALATVTEMTEEVKAVLRYNRLIINTLTDSVSTNRDNYEIKFEVPPPQFWRATCALFASKEFAEYANRAHAIVGYQKCPIEMRHFFVHQGEWYPLYNTSILVDLYKLLLSYATEEEFHQHIRLTLTELLEGTFNASDTTRSRFLVEPRAIDTETGQPCTNNRLTFMTICENRALVAINLGGFADVSAAMTEIQGITSLHENNRLGFVETYYRKELGGGYGCEVKQEDSIHYLLIEPHTDITTTGMLVGTTEGFVSCSALDLIYILGFTDSFDELLEFIKYDSRETANILAFGGKSSLFFLWKNSHRHIESGAVEYNHIWVQHGTADDYVFTHYTENLSNYPFSIQSKMFFNPLAWNTQTGGHGFTEFKHKGCFEWVGEGRMLGASTFVFLTHDIRSFGQQDFSQQNLTLLKTVDELNRRLFDRYSTAFCALPLLQNKTLEVMFTPVRSDEETFTSRFVDSKIHIESHRILLSYSVVPKKLLSAIGDAKDRSVECAYFLELIEPLKDYLPSWFPIIENTVRRDVTLGKQVDVMVIEQDYYYSSAASNIILGPLNFAKARKKIAEACLATGIEPGIYTGRNATRIVRQMQTIIVQIFEEMVTKYDWESLHQKILSYYATQLHGAMINLKRYLGFRTLESSSQQEFDDSTVGAREESRRNARTALYLLESNLALGYRSNTSQCKELDLADLLGLADWLVTLQDNSDVCHFTEFDVSIEVDGEFKVNTIMSKSAEQQYQEILSRKYRHKEYGIKHDARDEDHFLKCADAFLADTGVELGILLSFLKYLQLGVVEATFMIEVFPNVFEATKENLVDGFLAYMDDFEHNYRKEISDVLDFITLDCHELKYLKGEKHDVLPIWDRENRNNRFEVKPMLAVNDKYVFSPVTMKQLKTFWENGFFEWYPPFEIGLDNVKKELEKWKRRYEDEMVQDIASLFVDAGFNPVYPEIEFRSRFPRHDFPDIGDYDVIAINQPKMEMWLIESKVLQKVGSVFEDQMQQKGFFFSDKNDEKFQRRIDYVKNNQGDIAAVLGIDLEGYTIVSYMVTNKLFLSRYKPIGFPIITYHELTRRLGEYQ